MAKILNVTDFDIEGPYTSTVRADGTLHIVINKIDSDDPLTVRRIHFIDCYPGIDLSAQRAAVAAQLGKPEFGSWPAIPDAEWQKVEDKAKAVWTDEVISTWRTNAAAMADSA